MTGMWQRLQGIIVGRKWGGECALCHIFLSRIIKSLNDDGTNLRSYARWPMGRESGPSVE